jgi:hypothetical protein
MNKFVSISLMAGLLVSSPTIVFSADVDLNTPEGAITAQRKIQCSTEDAKPVFYWWKGKVLARRMGEKDKVLFNIEGMNVRQCVTVDGGKQGKSFKLVSREVLLYLDAKTGQPLETWDNPWTGKTVKVLQVENDPVNQPARFPRNKDGKALPWMSRFNHEAREGNWWFSLPFPLYYNNVLGGDYQKQIGGIYHATEMFNFFGDLESLTSDSTDSAKAQVGWVRMSDWLPWMEMSGREGVLYMHAAGSKVSGFDALGDTMKTYINKHAPLYKAPPPVTDDRPNETSWSYYKKMIKGAPLPR